MGDFTQRDVERIREQAETLAGQRGAPGKPQAAIRRGELTAIGGRALLSTQVSAAPTQAQHNALQADVKAIHEALLALSRG